MGVAVDHKPATCGLPPSAASATFPAATLRTSPISRSGLAERHLLWHRRTRQVRLGGHDRRDQPLQHGPGEWTDWSEKNARFTEPWAYGIAPRRKGKVYFAVWGGGLIEYDDQNNYMEALHRSRRRNGNRPVQEPGADPHYRFQRHLEPRYQDGLGFHLFWLEWLRRTKLAQLPDQGQRPGLRFHQRAQVTPQRSLGLHGQGPQHARLHHQHLGQLSARQDKTARAKLRSHGRTERKRSSPHPRHLRTTTF